MNSQRLTAWLRTVVPGAWSALLAWLVSLGVPHQLIDPAGNLGQTVLVPLALAGVYAALRWAEPRLPDWARRILLGAAQSPTYPSTAKS